jgi:hypothetical protein
MAKCDTGVCGVSCVGACFCWGPVVLPAACGCSCEPVVVTRRENKPAKGVKKIPFMKFKRMIKENPQTRFNICARDMPITGLAQSFDKVLPNRILVPANRLNKKVTLSLKNNTMNEIINSSGLTLKS